MANTIKLKSSSVPGKIPSTTDLQLRELGVNTTDGKLYLKKSVSGTESIVEVGAAGSGITYTTSVTPPTNPNPGDIWTDANSGITYQWLYDGTSAQWVELGPVGQRGSIGPKSITLVNPTNSESLLLFFTDREETVSQVRSVVIGASSPSVSFSIRYGSDVTGIGTELIGGGLVCNNTTTGLSTTTFSNSVVPANSFVWLTTSSVSGNTTALHITMTFV